MLLLLVVSSGGAVIGQRAEAEPSTWNFGQADVFAAQAAGHDGAGVTVAVVDTWVDFTHPDFGGRVVDEAYCVGRNGSCLDHRYAPDACVHGTHVAGTVASADYGVAPAARILAVQVLAYDPPNGQCSGSTTDVAAGIRWAVAHGARVVNLSLGDLVPGLFQSSDVTTAVHTAANAGAVVVIAAGNDSLPLTDSYGSDGLLVAATGPSGQLATYSDRGGSVALAAPGGDDGAGGINPCTPSDCILSTEPHDRYGLLEGTSMAAPHVAGTVALLLAQDPGRGRADVFHALESTARPLAGAGYGLLDSAAALSLRAGRAAARPPTPAPAPRPSSAPGGAAAGTAVGARAVPAGPATSPRSTATTAVPARRPAATPRTASHTGAGGLAPRYAAPAVAGNHRTDSVLWPALLGALFLLGASAAVTRRILRPR